MRTLINFGNYRSVLQQCIPKIDYFTDKTFVLFCNGRVSIGLRLYLCLKPRT